MGQSYAMCPFAAQMRQTSFSLHILNHSLLRTTSNSTKHPPFAMISFSNFVFCSAESVFLLPLLLNWTLELGATRHSKDLLPLLSLLSLLLLLSFFLETFSL